MPSNLVTPIRTICCVGSSFAAGPGIEPVAHVGAGRSRANFAQTTADLLKAAAVSTGWERPQVVDVSVSGATLANIVDERQKPLRPAASDEKSAKPAPGQLGSDGLFPPQVTGVPTDADLILFTAGGNDVGYLSTAVRDCMAASGWLGWLMSCVLGFFAPKPALQHDDEAGLTKRLAAAIDALHARAPRAHIVLVEYLALFPVPGASSAEDAAAQQAMASTYLKKEQVAHYAGIAQMLTRTYATVAGDAQRKDWCSIVHVDEPSRKAHALGSDDPWVDGFHLGELMQSRGSGKIPLHPNKTGMDAVASMIVTHIAQTVLQQTRK